MSKRFIREDIDDANILEDEEFDIYEDEEGLDESQYDEDDYDGVCEDDDYTADILARGGDSIDEEDDLYEADEDDDEDDEDDDDDVKGKKKVCEDDDYTADILARGGDSIDEGDDLYEADEDDEEDEDDDDDDVKGKKKVCEDDEYTADILAGGGDSIDEEDDLYEADEDDEEDEDDVKGKKNVKEDMELEVDIDNAAIEEAFDDLLEDENLPESFKRKSKILFTSLVNEEVRAHLNDIILSLEEQYSEQAKQDLVQLVEGVSDYVEHIADKWLEENEIAVDKGIRNNILENAVANIKEALEDSGIEIDEDQEDVVAKIEEEAETLKERYNNQVEENIALSKKNEEYIKLTILEAIRNEYDLSESEMARLEKLTSRFDFQDAVTFAEDAVTILETFSRGGNQKRGKKSKQNVKRMKQGAGQQDDMEGIEEAFEGDDAEFLSEEVGDEYGSDDDDKLFENNVFNTVISSDMPIQQIHEGVEKAYPKDVDKSRLVAL